MSEYTLITKASHPKLWEAFFSIAYDACGTTTEDRQFPEKFLISNVYNVNEIEDILSTLLKYEFDEFIMGDIDTRCQMLEDNNKLSPVDDLFYSFYTFYIEESENLNEIYVPIA